MFTFRNFNQNRILSILTASTFTILTSIKTGVVVMLRGTFPHLQLCLHADTSTTLQFRHLGKTSSLEQYSEFVSRLSRGKQGSLVLAYMRREIGFYSVSLLLALRSLCHLPFPLDISVSCSGAWKLRGNFLGFRLVARLGEISTPVSIHFETRLREILKNSGRFFALGRRDRMSHPPTCY